MRRLHTDYSISLLEEKDVPGLVKLEQACFSTAWTEEQYRSFFAARYALPRSLVPSHMGYARP